MENSARIVCILPPSIRHARIPETPDRRRATASLRTLRNARRTNDIILTTSIPSLPNCSANSSMDRLSSRLEREWPETSNFSNFPSPRLLFQRIGSKKASGVFNRVLNRRRKEEGREYSRLIEDASRLESRSAAKRDCGAEGCLNSWHRRLIHN